MGGVDAAAWWRHISTVWHQSSLVDFKLSLILYILRSFSTVLMFNHEYL